MHGVRLNTQWAIADVDAEVLGLLRTAYEQNG
ncbi:MAG: hypothetical protein JWP46_1512 [Modestobacter sp.]|nr:hypothetical protein [Modestobacter sp.]